MPPPKKPVYLVDGSSYIHRAYHAIRSLSNSKGFPTNAVFGFTKMVLKLLAEKQPTHMAVVFDAKGPTFRHEIYKEYKANRPPMPEDLAQQMPIAKEIVEQLDIKMLEKEGYEADDVIGTLARMCEQKKFRVVIVTGDKDFRQLVTPEISMWDTMKDAVIDYGVVKDAYGLEPERLIDVMGLCGDSIDNIPGIPGVGEKTAVKLIHQFGSLENVLQHVDEITTKKLKENVANSREEALLSKKLVTIDQFVPMEEEDTQLALGMPRRGKLSEIFRELEFRDLWEQFSTREEETTEYVLVLSEDQLHALVDQIRDRGMLSVDTETTSPDPFAAQLVGISCCCEERKAYYLPIAHAYPGAPPQLQWNIAREILRPVLEDEGVAKVGQNIKYDVEVLKRHGIELRGIHFDTMIASYLLNPGLRQHGLDSLAQHYLNRKMITYEDVAGKGKAAVPFSHVEVGRAKEYSCEDADITWRLMEILDRELRSGKNEELFYDLEMKLVPVLMDMEMTGVKLDTPFLETMSADFAAEMGIAEQEIYKEAGMEFNINSPQQLGFVLFEKLQLPGQKKTAKSKRYSTDVKVLEKLSAFPHRLPKLVLRYRTLAKLKSTYLDALVQMVNPSTGRLHTSYNQTVTATGRLSSSNPNLQNIPIRTEEGRAIRKAFVAQEGHVLVSADYSQVELRVFAHYSKDAAFLEAFAKGEDIHSRTASEIRNVPLEDVTPDMRRIAKAINFGIIYGMGPRRLSEEQGIDLKTAKDYIAQYLERYEGAARYREEMIETARKEGFVTTLFNRRRYLPNINHSDARLRAEAERMAINTPIQGTAADLIKKAMIHIHQKLRQGPARSKMLLQVHDELVFEVPGDELEVVMPMIKEEMEGVYPLRPPLQVEIHTGRNWDEAH